MKTKPLFWLLSLSLILCLALSGCGGSQDATKPTDQKDTVQKDTVQQDSAQPATPPVTDDEKTTPEPAKEPSSDSDVLGDRLGKTYTDMMASGKYYMKYRMTTDGKNVETEMATNGDDFATKTFADGIEVHMIIKDNKLYMINPAEKMVTIMNSADQGPEQDIDYSGLTFVREGKGDFLGKTLPYEEYSADGGTTKYFFDGKKLVGMESNYEDITLVMEILELSEKIPSGLFEIPTDYVQQNLG